MLNTLYVQFDDAKHNYYTSVNALSSYDDLCKYFVGNTFFVGTCDTQESDPQYWQTVKKISLIRRRYEVVSGSFIGKMGTIKRRMLRDLYMLDVGDGEIAVTSGQIKEIE